MNRFIILRQTLELFRSEPNRFAPNNIVDALAWVALENHASVLPVFDDFYAALGPGKSLVEWQSEPRTHSEVLALLERVIAIAEGRRPS
ncbi:MAG: hypothetical protein ACRD68_00070 [Pyrinomonadaceae bacterium]